MPLINLKERWLDLCDEHPRLEQATDVVKRWIPPLNYITVHYLYFIIVTAVSSLIFWGSSTPFHSVSYVDSLFLVTSSVTGTGLNTLNLSSVSTWQQVLLWLLFILGSNIWVSFWTVMFRKRAFEQRFEDIVEKERDMRKRIAAEKKGNMSLRRAFTSKPDAEPIPSITLPRRTTGVDSPLKENKEPEGPAGLTISIASSHGRDSNRTLGAQDTADNSAPDHISFVEPVSPRAEAKATTSAYEPGGHLTHRGGRRLSDASTTASGESEDFLYHWKKILNRHNVSRNGQFYDLTSEQRERLGGTEYRALKILAYTVPLYAFTWQFIWPLALGAYTAHYLPNPEDRNGANGWWAGIFFGVSAFNNAGMSLLDDSMVPFLNSYFVLIIVGLLVLAGNTAYPIFLRLILWTFLKLLNMFTAPTSYAPWKETLEFILKYPRRVYTTLFPSRATWWLLAVLVLINLTDWVAFELMNLGNPAVGVLSVGQRIIGGLFQAVSVRAAGFVVISISTLYIGNQTLYFIMMYISVYPVVITMRNSNVYEERSLGIYEDDSNALARQEEETTFGTSNSSEPSRKQFLRRRGTGAVLGKTMKSAFTFNGVGATRRPKPGEESSPVNFVGQQIRGQLAHDVWWLVLATLVIVTIETDHFRADPVTYSVFNVLFETTSAYSCVGLSVGLPDQSYSFSGGWHTASKVVLCLVMLRGRHRGLPVAVDRAVRLPGDKMRQEEEHDSNIRRTKTMVMQRVASQS